MSTSKILVFAGSTRAASLHRQLAQRAAEALRRAGMDATFSDLRDYPMPLYDGDLEAGSGVPATAKALKELFREADGFVIASPEYNGSYPALLKNAIDWVSRPEPGERPLAAFRGKIAAILSASPGPGGGRRGLRQLRELLGMIGVTVIPEEVAIAQAGEAFDGAGGLTRPHDAAALEQLAAGLALAAGKETIAA
jgi:NAD(P)H-dependent FMN reductase